MMADFVYHLKCILDYADSWLNIITVLSMKIFPEEIRIWTGRLCRADGRPEEDKRLEESWACFVCLCELGHPLSPCLIFKLVYVLYFWLPGSQDYTPTEGRSWVFSASIVTGANNVTMHSFFTPISGLSASSGEGNTISLKGCSSTTVPSH